MNIYIEHHARGGGGVNQVWQCVRGGRREGLTCDLIAIMWAAGAKRALLLLLLLFYYYFTNTFVFFSHVCEEFLSNQA